VAFTKTIQITGDGHVLSNGVSYPVTNTSATYEDCYIKVATVIASKSEGQATVVFSAKTKDLILFERNFLFPIDLEGPNPIKQAYLHLKTLPEFADAIDC